MGQIFTFEYAKPDNAFGETGIPSFEEEVEIDNIAKKIIFKKIFWKFYTAKIIDAAKDEGTVQDLIEAYRCSILEKTCDELIIGDSGKYLVQDLEKEIAELKAKIDFLERLHMSSLKDLNTTAPGNNTNFTDESL